jgi:hypothetical protein
MLITFIFVRNICCLGLCKDFYKRRKYNLVELVKPKDVDPPIISESKDANASENKFESGDSAGASNGSQAESTKESESGQSAAAEPIVVKHHVPADTNPPASTKTANMDHGTIEKDLTVEESNSTPVLTILSDT